MAPQLLRIEEFCSRYGVSRSTVYRLRARNAITLFKIGNASRIKAADADAWFASLQAN